jgi:hypothetical protein
MDGRSSVTFAAWTALRARNFIFLINARKANTKTMALREIVSDEVVIPMGDNPKKSPDNPVMLKLNATDKTAFSTKSSFPS